MKRTLGELIDMYGLSGIPWREMRSAACPDCGKCGLHYPGHPHAFGYKDYSRVSCRFCRTIFRKKGKPNTEPAQRSIAG